jgi:hypothetical protein
MDRLDPAFENQQQQGIPGGSRSPTYEGRSSASSLPKYGRSISSSVGVNTMSVDAPPWVKQSAVLAVPILLGAIFALLIYIASDFKADVNTKFTTLTTKVDSKFDTLTTEMHKSVDTLAHEMNQNHVELVKEISTIAGRLEPRPKDNHR